MLNEVCWDSFPPTSHLGLPPAFHAADDAAEARPDTYRAGRRRFARYPHPLLSLVQGNAAQLESSGVLPEEARRKARIIREQSQRIGRLVSDLNLCLHTGIRAATTAPGKFLRPAAMLRAAAAELLNMLSDDRVSLEVDIPSEARAP